MSNRRTLLFPAAAGLLIAALTAVVFPSSAGAAGFTTIADWRHDDSSTVRTLTDSSANRLNGTVGTSVTTGVSISGAIGHRRSTVAPDTSPYNPNRLATVPHSSKLNPGSAGFAVELRIRTTAPQGNIVQKGQSGTSGGYWKVEMDNGIPACLFRGSAGSRSATTTKKVNDGAWHTIRCERSATGATMFIDGVSQGFKSGASGTISNTKVLSIGGKASCNQTTVGCDYYSGDIDYVRLQVAA